MPTPRNQLWLPRPTLSQCVRAIVSRDTRGAALPAQQRFNHAAATPLCCLIWYLTGSAELLAGITPDLDAPRQPLPSQVVLCGPQSGPSVAYNPGDVHSVIVFFHADACESLLGIAPVDLLDKIVDAATVLPTAWHTWCKEVAALSDEMQRLRHIEDFLDARWQGARGTSPSHGASYHDWLNALSQRLYHTTMGRSVRQVERRMRQFTGQSLRTLRGLARAEQSYFAAKAASSRTPSDAAPTLADLAADQGYADQSHFSREVRRLTGFPPHTLRQLVQNEESFWLYRLWI